LVTSILTLGHKRAVGQPTKGWVVSRATEILKTNPIIGAKKLQIQLEQQFPIKISYCKVWEGLQRAKQELHGTWENNFKMLWSFKAQLEETCP
jgi:hypothetical protein